MDNLCAHIYGFWLDASVQYALTLVIMSANKYRGVVPITVGKERDLLLPPAPPSVYIVFILGL
jgi:hypothetical protein